MKRIEEIDRNFAVENKLSQTDVVWYDVKESPFQLYGLYDPKGKDYYRRLDEDIAAQTNEGVKELNLQPAGGRIRFATDSPYVAIHAELPYVSHMMNMCTSGSASFDLYEDFGDHSTYINSFLAPNNGDTSFERISRTFATKKMRCFTLHFPLYNGVNRVYIGLQEGAKVEGGQAYKPDLPILYYGSSITQGGCSSRPGLCYQAIIARRMNRDFINLGFSGSARAEEVIANYIASVPCSVFVYDYDHNAPTLEHLEQTHERMYKTIRQANPDLPIIIVGKPDGWIWANAYEWNRKRRDILMRTYLNARAAGDENVHYIDGFSLFSGREADECTVDGCHPNDRGFERMADAIGMQIEMLLDGEK